MKTITILLTICSFKKERSCSTAVSCGLRCQHSIWVPIWVLGTPISIHFPTHVPGKTEEDSPGLWAHAPHMEDKEVPGFGLDSPVCCNHFRSEQVDGKFLSFLSLCVSLWEILFFVMLSIKWIFLKRKERSI